MENFNELNLSPPLARAIKEMGYEKPTPIQAQALPLLLGDRTDFLGLAATGTGKTAAFGIPMLEKIDTSHRHIQCVVMCPTRELAIQVAGQISQMGKYKGIQALPIYGGAGYGDQLQGLRRGTFVVVATPGRLVDHLDRGTVKLDQVRTVILDEADEMISMGFKEDIEYILKHVDVKKRNTWLFSATMGADIRKVAHTYMHDPKQAQINKTEMLSGTVEQVYYMTREGNKPDVLCKLIDAADDFYGLIFCQTKSLVMDLTDLLKKRGYHVDCLHGDKSQKERERTMGLFRERKVNMLICTDVAARGLDVKELTHVINYSISRELDSYVHRIGRTGRSGKKGMALSLVTPNTLELVSRLERMTKTRMKQGVIPTQNQIGSKKLTHFLAKLQEAKNHQRAEDMIDEAWEKVLEGMSKKEIAGRFLALSYPDLFVERPPEPSHHHRPTTHQEPHRDKNRRYGHHRSERSGPFVSSNFRKFPGPKANYRQRPQSSQNNGWHHSKPSGR